MAASGRPEALADDEQYFTKSKGRERVLIIRENGTKMPADVGGNIYLPLPNRKDIS